MGDDTSEAWGCRTTGGQHVDDVSQLIIKPTTEDAFEEPVRDGSRFAEMAVARGCELSKKTVVVARPKALGERVARRLTALGYEISAAEYAEGLGIQTAACSPRVAAIMRQRKAKGSR